MSPAAAQISPLPEQSGPGAPRPPLELSDVSVMIGGQGGDGTLTVSDLLGRYFRKKGLYVYTSRNVLSRIRGGHADASVRASRDPLTPATRLPSSRSGGPTMNKTPTRPGPPAPVNAAPGRGLHGH